MFRYSNILSDFSDASMLEREVRLSSSRKTAGGVVQPLLPSMLAACAPAAELTLIVQATQGKPAAPPALLHLFCAVQKWPLAHDNMWLRNSIPSRMRLRIRCGSSMQPASSNISVANLRLTFKPFLL